MTGALDPAHDDCLACDLFAAVWAALYAFGVGAVATVVANGSYIALIGAVPYAAFCGAWLFTTLRRGSAWGWRL